MIRVQAALAGCALMAMLQGCATTASTVPRLIAHRGASHDAPENTLAAFRLAWDQGADGIEGDFHLSADGQVVCCHDATTGRTAGLDLPCASTPAARLVQLDVGSWKGAAWRDQRMPTLAQVLDVVPADKCLFIEIKSGPDTVEPVRAAVAAAGVAPQQIAIISFDAEVIRESKRRMPAITANWLSGFERAAAGDVWCPTVGEIIATARACNADGVGLKAAAHIDAAFCRALADAGLDLHVWTVNDPQVARRFIELGVQSVTTDRPEWLRVRLAPPGPR